MFNTAVKIKVKRLSLPPFAFSLKSFFIFLVLDLKQFVQQDISKKKFFCFLYTYADTPIYSVQTTFNSSISHSFFSHTVLNPWNSTAVLKNTSKQVYSTFRFEASDQYCVSNWWIFWYNMSEDKNTWRFVSSNLSYTGLLPLLIRKL